MYLYIYLVIYLLIYQLFWTQACPEEMCTNGTQVPCVVQSLPNPITRKVWPHHRGLRPLLFLNNDVGSFMSRHKNKSVKVLWDGTYGFSSLSEKTRKSNHLQMSLQRQHFLLSYFKTLSVCLRADVSYFLCCTRKRDVCVTPSLIVFQHPAGRVFYFA